MNLSEKIFRLKRLKRNLIPEKQEDYERLKALAIGGGISYDKVGGSGSRTNAQEIKNANSACCSEELEQLKSERDMLTLELQEEFNRIFFNDKQRRIAKLYYIDGIQLKSIANKHLHYGYGTVRNDFVTVNKALGIENNDTK